MNKCPVMLYTAPDGKTQLDVKLENETVWLTQEQIAILFGKDRFVIVRHINNIYKEGELEEFSTCAKNAQVRLEGQRQVTRIIPFYNLDMILSVGYRTNSKQAIAFRRWSSSVLKQYLIKGYVIDQRRLDHYNELKDVVKLMSRVVQRWQQTNRGDALPLVPIEEQHPLCSRWSQAHSRQHPGCPHIDDSREPH